MSFSHHYRDVEYRGGSGSDETDKPTEAQDGSGFGLRLLIPHPDPVFAWWGDSCLTLPQQIIKQLKQVATGVVECFYRIACGNPSLPLV